MGVRRSVLLVVVTALVTVSVLYPLLIYSVWLNYLAEGLHQVRLIPQCIVIIYEPPWQPSVLRLAGSILIENDDEWQAAERRYFSLETMRELTHPEVLLEDLGPLRLAPIH